jgi:catechol-2,3-dioxygenase
VALFEVEDGEEVHAGSEVNHMALRLASGELARVKATLENAGIKVNGRPGDPTCIYFSDPDGHRLQLLMPNE